MKTLGQIIDEDFPKEQWEYLINYAYGEPMLALSREELEGFALNVREAVIEECAKVCEDTFIDYVNGEDGDSGFSIYGDECAKELRKLIKKDKK